MMAPSSSVAINLLRGGRYSVVKDGKISVVISSYLISIQLVPHNQAQFLFDVGLSQVGSHTKTLGGFYPIRLRKATHNNRFLFGMDLKASYSSMLKQIP